MIGRGLDYVAYVIDLDSFRCPGTGDCSVNNQQPFCSRSRFRSSHAPVRGASLPGGAGLRDQGRLSRGEGGRGRIPHDGSCARIGAHRTGHRASRGETETPLNSPVVVSIDRWIFSSRMRSAPLAARAPSTPTIGLTRQNNYTPTLSAPESPHARLSPSMNIPNLYRQRWKMPTPRLG